jgi:hypothetical protein
MRRWFAVPRVGSGTVDDEHRPKYGKQADGWAGQAIDMDRHPIGLSGWWYLARFSDTEANLDTLEQQSDAYTFADTDISPEDVAAYLNDKTGLNLTVQEWASRFVAGDVDL